MKWPFLLLTVLGVVAQHRIDLYSQPWSAVMDAMRSRGDLAAQTELERVAQLPELQPWERSHAWRWAGQLAVRGERLPAARRDFERARAIDPTGFDARMATLHLGEVSMRESKWYEAQRWLVRVEFDPDGIISTYAQDRLRSVRERTRRLTARYAAITWLGLCALALIVRIVRRIGRRGTARSFGRALLVAEALAIVSAGLVPRLTTQLAQSGWMAFALPFGLVGAVLWSTRERDAPWWQRIAVLLALGIAMAAGLYLALDFTWWSVERPVM